MQPAAIRDYASQGYNLIIAHGSQYGSSLQEIAPDFPRPVFAWGTTVDTFGQPNIFAYQASAEEGGFVNGVMAATLSKSNVIGVVGPIETGDARSLLVRYATADEGAPDLVIQVLPVGHHQEREISRHDSAHFLRKKSH